MLRHCRIGRQSVTWYLLWTSIILRRFISVICSFLRKRRRRRNCPRLFREASTAWVKRVSWLYCNCYCCAHLTIVSISRVHMLWWQEKNDIEFVVVMIRGIVASKHENCRRWVFCIKFVHFCASCLKKRVFGQSLGGGGAMCLKNDSHFSIDKCFSRILIGKIGDG